MLIGETFFRSLEAEGDNYYSPWFPRQGNRCTFVCDVIHSTNPGAAPAGLALKITTQTKKSEDDDSTTDIVNVATTTINYNVAGGGGNVGQDVQVPFTVGSTFDQASTGFNDLVRFRYELSDGSTGDMLHLRMLVGAWFTD